MFRKPRYLPAMVSLPPVQLANRRSSGSEWGEVPGGRDLYPEGNITQWTLLDDDRLKVLAAPLHHTVSCVGFIVTEKTRPGRLVPERVMPKLEANRELLGKQGVRNLRSLFKRIKALGPDEEFKLPNGDVLRGR